MFIRTKHVILCLFIFIFTLNFIPVFAQEDLIETFTSSDGSITLNYPAGWVAAEQEGQVLGGNSQAALDASNNSEPLSADQVVFAFYPAFTASDLEVSPDAAPLEVFSSPAFGGGEGLAPEERTIGEVKIAFATFDPEATGGGPNLAFVRSVDTGLYLIMVGVIAPESIETYLPTLLNILASVSYMPPPPSGGIAVEIPSDQIPVPTAGEGDVVWQISVEDGDPYSGLYFNGMAVDAQDNIYVEIPVEDFAEVPDQDDWGGMLVLNADGTFQRSFYNQEIDFEWGSNDLGIASDGSFWVSGGDLSVIELVHLDSNGNLLGNPISVYDGYSVNGMVANVIGSDGNIYAQVDSDPIDIVAPDGSLLGNFAYEGRLLAAAPDGFLFFAGELGAAVEMVDLAGNPALSIPLPDGATVRGVAAGAGFIYIAGSNSVIYQFDSGGTLVGSFAFPPEEFFSVDGMAVLADGDLVVADGTRLTRLRISGMSSSLPDVSQSAPVPTESSSLPAATEEVEAPPDSQFFSPATQNALYSSYTPNGILNFYAPFNWVRWEQSDPGYQVNLCTSEDCYFNGAGPDDLRFWFVPERASISANFDNVGLSDIPVESEARPLLERMITASYSDLVSPDAIIEEEIGGRTVAYITFLTANRDYDLGLFVVPGYEPVAVQVMTGQGKLTAELAGIKEIVASVFYSSRLPPEVVLVPTETPTLTSTPRPTSTSRPTATPEPTSSVPAIRVRGGGVRVLNAPENGGRELAFVTNRLLLITGISTDGNYYRVDYDGQEAWVRITLTIATEGDLSNVPVIETVSTQSVAATPTLTPAPTEVSAAPELMITAPGSYQSEIGCPTSQGVGGDWAPDCLLSQLFDNDGDGVYTFITTEIPAGNYEVKAAFDQNWDLNYGAEAVRDGANIPFVVPRNGAQIEFAFDTDTNLLTVTIGDESSAAEVAVVPEITATFTSTAIPTEVAEAVEVMPTDGGTFSTSDDVFSLDYPTGWVIDEELDAIASSEQVINMLRNQTLQTLSPGTIGFNILTPWVADGFYGGDSDMNAIMNGARAQFNEPNVVQPYEGLNHPASILYISTRNNPTTTFIGMDLEGIPVIFVIFTGGSFDQAEEQVRAILNTVRLGTEGGLRTQGEIAYDQTHVFNTFSGGWTFTGTAGDVISIEMANVFHYEDGFWFELLDPAGQSLVNTASDDPLLENFTLPASGTYIISHLVGVGYFDQPYATFLVKLTLVSPGSPDTANASSTAPDVSTATPIISEEVVSETLEAGATAVYTFTASAGEGVRILMSSGNFDPDLTLYDPNGSPVALDKVNEFTGMYNQTVTAILPADGNYILSGTAVDGVSGGSYLLALQIIPAETVQTYVDELTEVDPAILGDIAYGETKTGTLEAGRPDQWSFTGSAGDSVTIVLTSNNFDTVLELYAADDIYLFGNDDYDGTNSQIEIVLPSDGTYTIFAAAYDGAAGDYTLTITRNNAGNTAASATSTPVPTEVAESGNTATAAGNTLMYGAMVTDSLEVGAVGEYSFEGSAGDLVTIVLTSDNFDTVLELYDASGAFLFGNDDFNATNSQIEFTLPADGIYTVRAKSYQDAGSGEFILLLSAPDAENPSTAGSEATPAPDTSTVEVAPANALAYDDFSSNTLDWELANSADLLSDLVNGVYTIEFNTNGDGYWIVAPGFFDWSKAPVMVDTAYELSFDVANASASNGVFTLAILFDVQQGYETFKRLYIHDNGTWELFRWVGQRELLASGNLDTPVSFTDGQTHRVTLQVTDEGYNLLIDGNPAAVIRNFGAIDGSIGFGVATDRTGTLYVEFDNLTINLLDGNTPPETAPSSSNASSIPTEFASLLTETAVGPEGDILVRYPTGWNASTPGFGEIWLSTPNNTYPLAPGSFDLRVSIHTAANWNGDPYGGLVGNEQSMADYDPNTTLEETTFAGDPGLITRTFYPEGATLTLTRKLANGDAHQLSANFAPNDLENHEAMITAIFLSMQSSAANDLGNWSTELPAGASPSVTTGAGNDICSFDQGVVVYGTQTPDDTYYVPLVTNFGMQELYGAYWEAVPGTTLTLQLLDPPAGVGNLKLSLIRSGFEFTDYYVLAEVPPNQPLTYTFDNRDVDYIVWVENGWTTDPTAFLSMSAICNSTPATTPLVLEPPVIAAPPVAVFPPIDYSEACNANAPEPRMIIGQRGWVLPEPPVPNNMRRDADANSPDVGDIQPGESFLVIGGPICSRNLNRWQVILDNGAVGWTGEGDHTGYWIEPLLDQPIVDCPGLMPPQLIIGQPGVILPGEPNALNSLPIRPSQDDRSVRLGSIPAGAIFTVLAGPVCGISDDIVWWRVDYNGTVGWTGESSSDAYWIEPVAGNQ